MPDVDHHYHADNYAKMCQRWDFGGILEYKPKYNDLVDAIMYSIAMSLWGKMTFWQRIKFRAIRFLHTLWAWMKGLGVN